MLLEMNLQRSCYVEPGMHSVVFIAVIGNEINDPKSKPEKGCLHLTVC